MKRQTLLEQLIEAVRAKDVEAVKRIKEQHGRERWLNQFGGKSVPISAWVDEDYNPDGVLPMPE